MKTEDIYLRRLIGYLLEQRSAASMEEALHDLLTQGELTEVARRLQILSMLEQGIPQRQIAEELGVGIATVTRGSHVMKKRQQTR